MKSATLGRILVLKMASSDDDFPVESSSDIPHQCKKRKSRRISSFVPGRISGFGDVDDDVLFAIPSTLPPEEQVCRYTELCINKALNKVGEKHLDDPQYLSFQAFVQDELGDLTEELKNSSMLKLEMDKVRATVPTKTELKHRIKLCQKEGEDWKHMRHERIRERKDAEQYLHKVKNKEVTVDIKLDDEDQLFVNPKLDYKSIIDDTVKIYSSIEPKVNVISSGVKSYSKWYSKFVLDLNNASDVLAEKTFGVEISKNSELLMDQQFGGDEVQHNLRDEN